jgi:uncharacterized membrane protein
MQNPPPSQPGYEAPTGNTPPPSPRPATGLEPNIAAALSYIWIVGVIFFILEKENRFVRFHALQSILFGVANTIIMFLLAIVAVFLTVVFSIGAAAASSGGGGGIATLVSLLVWVIWLIFWFIGLAMFVGLIIAAVKAYQGQKFKLPIIGNMAEKMVNKQDL